MIKRLEGKLPNLTKEAYKVALERDIKKVGKKLIQIYKEVLDAPSFEYVQNEKKIKEEESKIIEKYRLKEEKELEKLKLKLEKLRLKEEKKSGYNEN